MTISIKKFRPKTTIVIDMDGYANDANGYDPELPHPMTDKIIMVDEHGDQSSITIGQLKIIMAVVAKYSSVGEAIDEMDHWLNG